MHQCVDNKSLMKIKYMLISNRASEKYSSYSEFVRKTALIKASKIITEDEKGANSNECDKLV